MNTYTNSWYLLGQLFRAHVICPNKMQENFPFDEYNCHFTMSMANTLQARNTKHISKYNIVKFNSTFALKTPTLHGQKYVVDSVTSKVGKMGQMEFR